MKDLNGRIGVVTGAGKGIGRAIAQRLLDENIDGLAILDWNGELLEQTAKELDPSGTRVLPLQCNIADAEQVHQVFEQINQRFGRVDILVNNAGITRDKMFHKMDRASWDAVINVNLSGPYNLCHEIYPLMREQGYGRIVNISSTSAFGNVGQSNYSATKAGLIGFTKTLAREGAPKNVMVNAIAPGYIDTDMFQAVPDDIIAEYLKNIPMKRLAAPSEVASVVSFLSGDDTSFMTGQCLIVSGGAQT